MTASLLMRREGIGRAAVSSAVATLCDYAAFESIIRVCAPGLATFLGCILGGIVNFSLNRYWAFGNGRRLFGAMLRYIIVSGTSAVANSCLVLAQTSWLHWQPRPAWLFARSLVFLGLTYPLFRHWVFTAAARDDGKKMLVSDPHSQQDWNARVDSVTSET